MCLILFSWKNHPDYKLILAANRDEFYARPTRYADYWEDHPEILAGRDLEARGTWLGLTGNGRFAAITNYRDPSIKKENAPSRGKLTTNFLKGRQSPKEYLDEINETGDNYLGFNLLVGDNRELWYYNNITKDAQHIQPGSYGLSNALLDTSWPKVELGKRLFEETVTDKGPDEDSLLQLLKNNHKPDDKDLPFTGIPYEWEKAISSMFIETETYGTCCSSLVMIDQQDRVRFVEKSYPVGDHEERTQSFVFEIL